MSQGRAEPAPLMVVEVTSRRPTEPAALRYVCRLCRQYCHPMKRTTAIHHLFTRHGFGFAGAEVAVDRAEGEYHTLLAERAQAKTLLDVLEVY